MPSFTTFFILITNCSTLASLYIKLVTCDDNVQFWLNVIDVYNTRLITSHITSTHEVGHIILKIIRLISPCAGRESLNKVEGRDKFFHNF